MGEMRDIELDSTEAAGAVAAIFDGLAQVAASLVELPAIRATCLGGSEHEGATERLAAGWDLASFTPTGAALLGVLEVAGATIEVLGRGDRGGRAMQGARGGRDEQGGRGEHGTRGEQGGRGEQGDRGEHGTRGGRGDSGDRGGRDFDRSTTSHEAIAAAWGAPPGRRISAMGLAPGPNGTVVRMSCALVLRLPVSALGPPVDVATLLAWHAALHAAERITLPAPSGLASALARLDELVCIPRRPRGRVEWARGVVDRVRDELGVVPREEACGA